MSAAVESYTCNLDHLMDTNAITKGLSQDLLPRKCGNQWSIQLESPKGVTSCQDKVNFHSQDEPATPARTPKESPDQAQELEVAQRPVLPRQPENQVEKPMVCTSRPGSPKPGSGPPETPKSKRGNQEIDQDLMLPQLPALWCLCKLSRVVLRVASEVGVTVPIL